MTLVNNHVLFSIMADRRQPVEWSRTGHTEVSGASAESRSSLRSAPRVRLSFLITPKTLAQHIELTECVMAAKKSGIACVPYHGRSSQLTSAAAAVTSVTANNNFAWAVGDWMILIAASGTVETRQLTSAVLASGTWTLGFTGALTGSYAAGAILWPLLFGEFACEEMQARSPHIGPVQISIMELVSSRSVQLGTVIAETGEGIGIMEVGSTFEVA